LTTWGGDVLSSSPSSPIVLNEIPIEVVNPVALRRGNKGAFRVLIEFLDQALNKVAILPLHDVSVTA
jgi:hypothetical protein